MKLLLHPLPVRLFHWIMFAAVMFLVITGLYLTDPWLTLPYGLIRKAHMLAGIILVLNFGGQVCYYLITGKYTEVLFTRHDLPNLRSFFRYTLFITETHPNYGRYNPGQKALFTSWGLAVIVSGVTSLPYFLPEFASWLSLPVGGLVGTRIVFYGITIYFLATIPLHLYLVFTEDPVKLQAMFSGYVNKEPTCKDRDKS
ncbi:cytochrome b/b6 domain-containing protein [Sporomusa acidovorans]|uniref:Cytochrome b561 bacterial/Ni-hydrogenase domain-containing protein n=1 Tax=Sporomusa acidovorans (strain ATCC 49682 / DSM 3132 / Mol) TaxID=1123286 RepID=A0ABZ3IX16_SPOA4|nr:cytochrome b/b6 domain-containing protein [Sporomusa acidovorans]OZC23622.1 putative Ni/Fe-hydrogenase B-type cytochrome subunit [Sporomusa acidovorans DSM 3132]SDE22764.1 Ni/Fe-hydrogenase 1 B-type cytochrome subunit [Sporomusa acidovorans]